MPRHPGAPYCLFCNTTSYQSRPSEPMGHGKGRTFVTHNALAPGRRWVCKSGHEELVKRKKSIACVEKSPHEDLLLQPEHPVHKSKSF